MNAAALNSTFSALADPTRRAIVARLARGAANVGELAKPFDISLPAVSRHLRVLERARLIAQERDGAFRTCRLTPAGLHEATDWLDFHRRFWSESLDRLGEHLKSPPKPRRKSHGAARRTRR
jgi:DNA-binding transcriptional ArsR family regulator